MIRVIESDEFSTTRFTLADWAEFHARVDELAANRGAELDNTTDVGVFPLFDVHEFERHVESGLPPGDYEEEPKNMGWICHVSGRGLVRVFGCELPDNETLDDALEKALDTMALYWSDTIAFFYSCREPGEQETPESVFEQVPWEEEDQ